MSAQVWIGLITATVGLVAAAVGLGNALLQGRKRTRADHGDDSPPRPAVAAGSKPVVLPGRAPFVNREAELAHLIARATAGRDNVLAIEGDRWIGKSATATEFAHCLLSGPAHGEFDPSDHAFLRIDAVQRCPSLAEICRHLSLLTDDQSLSVAAEEHKRDRLRIHLAGNPTVLVLDNLSLGADDESHALVDFLRDFPNGSLLIAAVNKPGALRAARVPLGDLDVSSVRKLIDEFVERLDLRPVEDFRGQFPERLHALIGGNPGMIEWFLRAYDKSSDTLEDRLAALEKGSGLEEIFESTWSGLDARARAILAACAFLAGEATARQLAVACDEPEDEVGRAAERLRREGLVTPVRASGRPTIYGCGQAFRLFVGSRTPLSRQRLMLTRLCDDYVEHWRASPEDAGFATAEIGALRVIRGELYDAGVDARMQALFRATLDILFTLGQFDELIDAAELAFRSASRAENFASAALAAAIKSCTHAIRGEAEFAADSFASGWAAAQTSGDAAAVARVQRCRAFLHYRRREPSEALRAIEGVEEAAGAAADDVNVVDALDLETAVSWYIGDFEACEAAAQRSLAASGAINWLRARAYPLRYLAEIAIQRHEPERAQAILDEAQRIATRFRDARQLARVSLTRARLCLLEMDLGAAESAVSFAVTEATRLGLSAESEEAVAMAAAVARAQRSWLWRRYYARRRPRRLTAAPIGGD